MKSFKKLVALVTLTFAASKTASGAPIPEPLEPTGQALGTTNAAVQVVDETISPSSGARLRRVSSAASSSIASKKSLLGGLAGILGKILKPITGGVGSGLQEGSVYTDAGLYKAGSALSLINSGVGSIASKVVNGAGQTISGAPSNLGSVVSLVNSNNGIVGDAVKVVGGAR